MERTQYSIGVRGDAAPAGCVGCRVPKLKTSYLEVKLLVRNRPRSRGQSLAHIFDQFREGDVVAGWVGYRPLSST